MNDSASIEPSSEEQPPGPQPLCGEPAKDERNVGPESDVAAVASPPSQPAQAPPQGTELHGRVVGVDGSRVVLDVGLASPATVPLAQFEPGAPPDLGAELDVVVDRIDASGDLLRARRKATAGPGKSDVPALGTRFLGRVVGMVKGGLEIQYGPMRGFMPASQVDPDHIKDISVFLGQDVPCEVIELDRKRNGIVVSRRRIVECERVEAQKKLLAELQAGQVHKGVVENLTDYGAFVNLGGVVGLVHIRDMSWKPVAHPRDVLQPGDQVDVRILKINRQRSRISLGLKQAIPDPWATVEERYPVGTRIQARIVRLAEFGAFAQVEEGVDGLIPLSETAWSQRPAQVSDVVEVGRIVDVVVIGVDGKRRRMGLSIKQVTEDPWTSVTETYPVNAKVTGRVSKLLEFGALVELGQGVEGLVHISELSAQRVRAAGDVVSVGQDIEVKVLSVDAKRRRIALSLKATSDRGEERAAHPPAGGPPQRKRKRPLRGGLASHFDW